MLLTMAPVAGLMVTSTLFLLVAVLLLSSAVPKSVPSLTPTRSPDSAMLPPSVPMGLTAGGLTLMSISQKAPAPSPTHSLLSGVVDSATLSVPQVWMLPTSVTCPSVGLAV